MLTTGCAESAEKFTKALEKTMLHAQANLKAHGKDWVKALEVRQHLDLDALKPKNPALRHKIRL